MNKVSHEYIIFKDDIALAFNKTNNLIYDTISMKSNYYKVHGIIKKIFDNYQDDLSEEEFNQVTFIDVTNQSFNSLLEIFYSILSTTGQIKFVGNEINVLLHQIYLIWFIGHIFIYSSIMLLIFYIFYQLKKKMKLILKDRTLAYFIIMLYIFLLSLESSFLLFNADTCYNPDQLINSLSQQYLTPSLATTVQIYRNCSCTNFFKEEGVLLSSSLTLLRRTFSLRRNSLTSKTSKVEEKVEEKVQKEQFPANTGFFNVISNVHNQSINMYQESIELSYLLLGSAYSDLVHDVNNMATITASGVEVSQDLILYNQCNMYSPLYHSSVYRFCTPIIYHLYYLTLFDSLTLIFFILFLAYLPAAKTWYGNSLKSSKKKYLNILSNQQQQQQSQVPYLLINQ